MTIMIGNVPVLVEWQTVFLALLVFYSSYLYVTKQQKKASLPKPGWWIGVVLSIIVIATIAAHEIGHAVVLYAYNNPIDNAGMSWWGAYVQPHYSFLAMSALSQILVSLAGPAANWIIAAICFVIVRRYGESTFENSVQYVGIINFDLGKYNLFPILILDGGHALDGVIRLVLGSQSPHATISTILGFVILFWYLFKYGPSRKGKPGFAEKIESI